MTHKTQGPVAISPVTRGLFLALLATVIWSFNFIAGRGLAGTTGPCTLALGRWLVAFIFIIPFALPEMLRLRTHFIRHWLYYLAVGVLGIAYFNTAIYWAAHSVPAINLSLIASSSPLFTVLLARLFFNDPLTLRRIGGIALALAGIVLLLTRGKLATLRDITFHSGDLLMLSAALSFAFYTLMMRKKPKECGETAFFGLIFTIGIVCLLPFSALEIARDGLPEARPELLGGLVYMGLGASLLAFWCWSKAISLVGPSRAALVYYSLPLFSGAEAVIFLGEPLLAVHFISAVLVLGGLALATAAPAFPKSGR